MNYFSNPHIVFEYPKFTSDGHELHAFTSIPLDCDMVYFNKAARECLEAEALWIASVFFDRVVVHQI